MYEELFASAFIVLAHKINFNGLDDTTLINNITKLIQVTRREPVFFNKEL